MSDEKQNVNRDFELMLLGASLARGEVRDRIMAAFPKGQIASEAGEMIDAIRNQDADEIKRWFAHRGCEWEKGQDLIQPAINKVKDEKERKWAIENMKGLKFLLETAPLAEAKAKAIAMLEKFVG